MQPESPEAYRRGVEKARAITRQRGSWFYESAGLRRQLMPIAQQCFWCGALATDQREEPTEKLGITLLDITNQIGKLTAGRVCRVLIGNRHFGQPRLCNVLGEGAAGDYGQAERAHGGKQAPEHPGAFADVETIERAGD